MKKANILIVSIVFALIIGVLLVFFVVMNNFGFFEKPQEPVDHAMKRYAAICTNPQMDGWTDLKESLEKTAAANHAAIEFLEEGFTDNKADASCIEMAVDSGVDGIVIYSNDKNLSGELDYAAKNSVPVVFVINGYSHDKVSEIGTDHAVFAQKTLEYIDETELESNNVAIISSNSSESYRSGRFSKAFNESGRKVSIHTFSGPHVFDANETVKELIASEEKTDLICCLDSTATLGVAQALVELNKVNTISIVGSGKNEEIVNMIQKGVITASFVLDYEKIGREAISIFNNFAGDPTSYEKYIISDIHVIDRSNVNKYIEEAAE